MDSGGKSDNGKLFTVWSVHSGWFKQITKQPKQTGTFPAVRKIPAVNGLASKPIIGNFQ
jgi:hypothetical protein